MIAGSRVCVVLPAYNAAATLARTVSELPRDVVDRILLVDDASGDRTVELARELGLETHVHSANRGYGGNQKTCYGQALDGPEEIVVMLHPDYQYSPRLVAAMASMVASGEYDVVLGSRLLGGSACRRHAALQVRRQPRPDLRAEPAARSPAFGVPHRVPRLSP